MEFLDGRKELMILINEGGFQGKTRRGWRIEKKNCFAFY